MGRSAAIDTTGGIVVINNGRDGTGALGLQPHLRRFNPDGTEDLSFAAPAGATPAGAPGAVAQDSSPPAAQPSGAAGPPVRSLGVEMTTDEDGRILVVGSRQVERSQAYPVVWRFNPDGTPDTSFGEGGAVTRFRTELVGYDNAGAVVVDDTGRILVAGRTYLPAPPDRDSEAEFVGAVAIWCFTPEGEPDESFGEGGRVVRSHGPGTTSAAAIRIDAEARIVVLSWAMDRGSAMSRFLPDGTPDEGFGGDGLSWQADLPVEAGLIPSTLTFDSSGRIVLAGSMWGNGFDMAVWRLNPDGTIDRSFGTDGFVRYDRWGGFGGAE